MGSRTSGSARAETRNSKLPFSIGNLRIRRGLPFPPGLSTAMQFSPRARRLVVRSALTVLLSWLTLPARLDAQQRITETTLAQSVSVPFRFSGRMNVTFGSEQFFGTATTIRCFTGLTAGHLLYDPKSGLGTDLYYEPDFYEQSNLRPNTVSYFAVLSGYQSAANVDPDSDPAFDYDMGYVLFAQPEFHGEWATFAAAPDLLVTSPASLVFGYAAETYDGDRMAFINIAEPFYLLRAPGLYENTSYYTQEGMSGGPVYISNGGSMELIAETVAGTSPPDPALSDVRAITSTEAAIFTNAEYVHGIITSGVITGPTVVAVGGVGKYVTDVKFRDGITSGGDIARYDELLLKAIGAHKHLVTITKLKAGKFKVAFSGSLPMGTAVTLVLLRDTLPRSEQVPLQTLTVTVQ